MISRPNEILQCFSTFFKFQFLLLQLFRTFLLRYPERLIKHFKIRSLIYVCLMVLNATFNNISVISWRSVILVEETGGSGENHRSVASHWQTCFHRWRWQYVCAHSRHEIARLRAIHLYFSVTLAHIIVPIYIHNLLRLLTQYSIFQVNSISYTYTWYDLLYALSIPK